MNASSSKVTVGLGVLTAVAVVAAACIGRKDIVPPIAPTPAPAPAVKHQLLVFSEDGCAWCAKLHAAMQEPEAVEALRPFAVSEINDRIKAWSYGVHAYPCMVVLDAGGKELGRHEGYLGAHALAAWLEAYR